MNTRDERPSNEPGRELPGASRLTSSGLSQAESAELTDYFDYMQASVLDEASKLAVNELPSEMKLKRAIQNVVTREAKSFELINTSELEHDYRNSGSRRLLGLLIAASVLAVGVIILLIVAILDQSSSETQTPEVWTQGTVLGVSFGVLAIAFALASTIFASRSRTASKSAERAEEYAQIANLEAMFILTVEDIERSARATIREHGDRGPKDMALNDVLTSMIKWGIWSSVDESAYRHLLRVRNELVQGVRLGLRVNELSPLVDSAIALRRKVDLPGRQSR